MSALTSADLGKPEVAVPPSRRKLSPEEIQYQLNELENAEFALSPQGKKRAKELRDLLTEHYAGVAVNKQAILRGLETEAEIEETANLAITALQAYVEAREKLYELRREYEIAWRAAQAAGIATAPRNRTAAPMSLSHRLAKVSRWGWYS